MKECPHLKVHTPPTFGPNFCRRLKFVQMNSSLGVHFLWLIECTHGVLISTTSSTMHIWGEKLCNWGEPERVPHYRGLRDHEHRQPTDRPCPSHSHDTDTLHLSSTVVSRKRTHGRGTLICAQTQGGGRIFVTSLHFTTKKRPCLHYHNLQQDIAHQHTRPVQA